jgi:23S rRNA pseudouridine1911/1915/1917 synthase
VHGLLARWPELAALVDPGGLDRPGIVHRLDKGTSGLLVVARTTTARSALVSQLAGRTVDRRYLTLVWGTLDEEEGLIDAPIRRAAADPTRMAVGPGGRDARTRYQVDRRYHQPVPATLLRCRLETGRTHQIRVHLSAIGHAVVGDPRYGHRGGRWPAGLPHLAPGRVWLHAAELALDHPATGARLRFSSPVPPDLQHLLDRMG